MKKIFISLIVLVIFGSIAAFFLVLTNTNRQLALLKNENAEYMRALEQNKLQIASIQSAAQEKLKMRIEELQTQQELASPSSQKVSGIYISGVESIQQNDVDVRYLTFWVKGTTTMPFDAMDLGLSFTNVWGSPTCTTGTVFSQYPSIDIKDTGLTITGVAGLSGNTIETGVINAQFASCLFRKKETAQKAKVALDATKTHIYSLGKPVLDLENSFKEITW